MGSISSGIGLISGIDTASLINQLMAIEARPRTLVQQRVTILESQKAAYLAINARLLALNGASTSLGQATSFDAKSVSVSDPLVLSASAATTAAVGSYKLAVSQLATNHQVITNGFAEKTTAIGAGTISFESAKAKLTRDVNLADLNGGGGIARGSIRITDRSGASANVDLSRLTTLQQVVEAINNTSGINVSAAITGDGLTLTDNTGLAVSNLIVANVGSTQTATTLGIAGNSAGTNTLTGTQINRITTATRLAALNDGRGIRTNTAGLDDLLITRHDGSTFGVDLASATTVGDVIDAINDAATSVTASLGDDGVSIKLVDSDPYSGTELSAASGTGSYAAMDLGLTAGDSDHDGTLAGDRLLASLGSVLLSSLRGGAGVGRAALKGTTPLDDLFQGAGLNTNHSTEKDLRIFAKDNPGANYQIDIDAQTTVQGLINTVSAATGGRVTLAIEPGTNQLRVTDVTGGPSFFNFTDMLASTAINDLGLRVSAHPTLTTKLGGDTQPLGESFSGGGQMSITTRDGAVTTVNMTGLRSVDDLIAALNNSGAAVTASINAAGTGIQLTDTSGGAGNFTVADASGTFAADLNIAASVAADVIDSNDLELQYITVNTKLADLNGGRGVAAGKFRISDTLGAVDEIDLTQGETTLQQVIDEINSRPNIQVTASINAAGDGIVLTDEAGGGLQLTVTDLGSTTAADLNIAGTDDDLDGVIDGSFERIITLDADDTLDDLRQMILDADLGISAALIHDGSAFTPWRLSLSSTETGRDGAFVFDDGGLGIGANVLVNADDAVVFLGPADPAQAVLITSRDNTLTEAIGGVTINLLKPSDTPVDITITRNDDAIVSTVNSFVESFNGLIDEIDKYDTYDAETNERGLLLGDGAIGSIRSRLFSMLSGSVSGVTGQFRFLSQVGLTVGAGGKLTFNETRFRAAMDADPQDVQSLFTATQITEAQEILPGVTIGLPGTTTLQSIGFGRRFADLIDQMSNSIDGTLARRASGIDTQIEQANRRIVQLNTLLASKRERLERQFAAMETALAELQSQNAALTNLSLAALSASGV